MTIADRIRVICGALNPDDDDDFNERNDPLDVRTLADLANDLDEIADSLEDLAHVNHDREVYAAAARLGHVTGEESDVPVEGGDDFEEPFEADGYCNACGVVTNGACEHGKQKTTEAN